MRMLKFLMVVPMLLLAGRLGCGGFHNRRKDGRPDGGA